MNFFHYFTGKNRHHSERSTSCESRSRSRNRAFRRYYYSQDGYYPTRYYKKVKEDGSQYSRDRDRRSMHNSISIQRNNQCPCSQDREYSRSNSPEQNIARSYSRETLQDNDKCKNSHTLQILTEAQPETIKESTDTSAVPEQV